MLKITPDGSSRPLVEIWSLHISVNAINVISPKSQIFQTIATKISTNKNYFCTTENKFGIFDEFLGLFVFLLGPALDLYTLTELLSGSLKVDPTKRVLLSVS